MRDGATGEALLAWLNAHADFKRVKRDTGCADINAQNLCDWRASGFSDWMDNARDMDKLRLSADVASGIVSATGGDPAEVGSRILTGKLIDIINASGGEEVAFLAKALSALRANEIASQKNKLAADKLGQDAQRLALERQKFQRQTCELFIKWAGDNKALTICADKKTSSSDKIGRLGKLMFGDLWETSPEAKT